MKSRRTTDPGLGISSLGDGAVYGGIAERRAFHGTENTLVVQAAGRAETERP